MAWTQSGNIKGASGSPGASGAQGASGVPGPSGASGAVGASGPAGTTTWSGITDKPAVIAAGVDAAAARNVIDAEYTGSKGVANGYAALDSSGLVPSSQLPSFVDDVLEYTNLAGFPATGTTGKIYTALDTNKVYRWGGSSYTEISPSPGSTDAVPEGSTNLYYTNARADGRITSAVGSTVQAYSATLTTYAGKTAPSGAVVGTTDTQALTNKDLSGSGNTFPSFIKRSVSTLTTPTTLASAAATDYVYFLSSAGTPGDPSYSSVTALLLGNGTNNSTTITDSSSLASNWTAAGNAKVSTGTKKYGTGAISFDGTNSYITPSAASTNFAFSGDFTVEFFYYASASMSDKILMQFGTGSFNPTGFPAIYLASNTVEWWVNGAKIVGSNTLTGSTWYHLAISRSGTSIRFFQDGTQVGSTVTNSTSYSCATSRPYIGGADYGSYWFNGFLDDIRITKGVGRYTGNFTAPTAEAFTSAGNQTFGTPTLPTAVSNTNQYTLKNIESTNSITPATTSSQTIDGSTPSAISPGTTVRVVSDGSNWRTV